MKEVNYFSIDPSTSAIFCDNTFQLEHIKNFLSGNDFRGYRKNGVLAAGKVIIETFLDALSLATDAIAIPVQILGSRSTSIKRLAIQKYFFVLRFIQRTNHLVKILDG